MTIYTGPLCNYCEAAKRLLTRNNANYDEIDISKVDGAMDEMIKKANGKKTIPQIFFEDQHIGGYDEVSFRKENKLQNLLNKTIFLNIRHTPLLQYLLPVGFGPSSSTMMYTIL